MPSLLSDWEKALILKEVRSVIGKPEAWCTNADALDRSGQSVQAWEETAVRFCLVGTAHQVISASTDDVIGVLADMCDDTSNFPYWRIAHFNDWEAKRHINVIRKLDGEIKKFEPSYVPPKLSVWAWFQSWKCKGI